MGKGGRYEYVMAVDFVLRDQTPFYSNQTVMCVSMLESHSINRPYEGRKSHFTAGGRRRKRRDLSFGWKRGALFVCREIRPKKGGGDSEKMGRGEGRRRRPSLTFLGGWVA